MLNTELMERKFKTADLAIALGHGGDSTATQVVLRRLQRGNLRSYSDFVKGIREKDSAPESSKRGSSGHGRGAGRSYSLVDIVWICMWDKLTQILGPKSPTTTQIHSKLLQKEMIAQGRLTEATGPSFASDVASFLYKGREPSIILISGENTRHPSDYDGDPPAGTRVEISDNTERIHETFTEGLRSPGGGMIAIAFRSFIEPALGRLREYSELGADVPAVPDYNQPDMCEKKLPPEEDRLIDILHKTPNIVGDITIEARDGSIRAIEYRQSFSPKKFSPGKALAEDDVKSLVSYPLEDGDGKVRRYVVTKRLEFD